MDKPWVKLTDVYGNLEGEGLKSFLEANDVPVRLIQESIGPLIGSVIPVFGLVEVFVPQSDLDTARSLLAEYEGETTKKDD